jgi:hypothetical protein
MEHPGPGWSYMARSGLLPWTSQCMRKLQTARTTMSRRSRAWTVREDAPTGRLYSAPASTTTTAASTAEVPG